jgi:hypothetical protein
MITIFCEKIGVILKSQSYDQIFAKTSSGLSKNVNIFTKFFGENILKITTSVPGTARRNEIRKQPKKQF